MRRLLTSFSAAALVFAAWGLLHVAQAKGGSSDVIAPRAPLNAQGRSIVAQMKTISDPAARDMYTPPTKAEFPYPMYPGALFANRMVVDLGGGQKMVGLNLVSKDAPDEVLAWFRKHLGPDWHYVSDLDGFVKDHETYDPAKMTEYTVIWVKAEDGTGFDLKMYDVHGLKSRIQVNYPAKTAKK